MLLFSLGKYQKYLEYEFVIVNKARAMDIS